MDPLVQQRIASHLTRLSLRCPMCGGEGPANWVLHADLVVLPVLDDELQPLPGRGFVVALLKCERCRFVAHFRAVGADGPQDLSANP